MVIMQSKTPDSSRSQAAGNWDSNLGPPTTASDLPACCAHFLASACEAVSSISIIGHFCSGIRSRSPLILIFGFSRRRIRMTVSRSGPNAGEDRGCRGQVPGAWALLEATNSPKARLFRLSRMYGVSNAHFFCLWKVSDKLATLWSGEHLYHWAKRTQLPLFMSWSYFLGIK